MIVIDGILTSQCGGCGATVNFAVDSEVVVTGSELTVCSQNACQDWLGDMFQIVTTCRHGGLCYGMGTLPLGEHDECREPPVVWSACVARV